MKLVVLYFSLFFFLCAKIYADYTDSVFVDEKRKVIVDSIKLSGNEITKDFIILRELTFSAGDTINGKTLRFNRERIFSLGLFSRVELYLTQKSEKNIVTIDVKESWYIYPIPFWYVQENELKKSTYGINFVYKNFRGRNETIRTMIGLGYNPYLILLYRNPAFLYEGDISMTIGFSYYNFSNRSSNAKKIAGKDFSNKFLRGSFGFGKRFDQFNSAAIGFGFDYIKPSIEPIDRITASGNNQDQLSSVTLSYLYDSRDLIQYAQNGIMALARVTHKGFGANRVNYNIFEVDFREFRKLINNLSGKWRLTYRHTFGKCIPFYDQSFLGYDELVRGNAANKREGNNYILTSLEMNYPILYEWDLSVKLPLLPEKLTSARIGIFIHAFYDAGSTFNNNAQLTLKDFYSGYGIGITFLILPFNAIRFEYALNELGKGEYLIGTGFSF